ncbi:MAG: FAD-dependent oxidoreductase [Nitrososphaerales archaeon]
MGTAAAGAAALGVVAGATSLVPSVAASPEKLEPRFRGPVLPSNERGLPSLAQPTVGLPSQWDKSVDVLIVGASGAGMSAAIEAATAGANTLIIEKMDHYGGLWLGAGGGATIGGNNHVQQKNKITGDSINQWLADEMKGCDFRGNLELYQTYTGLGDAWLSWMESLGAVWAAPTQGVEATTTATSLPVTNYTSGSTNITTTLTPETVPFRGVSLAASSNYPTTNGFSWVYLYAQQLATLKVPIQLNTAMTGIYREPGGNVVGVAAITPTGPINIMANKAVVIATGGCADNLLMCYSFDPRINGDTYHDGMGPPGTPDMVQNTGDGHLAAVTVGAGLSDMSYVIYLPIKWGSHLYWGWPTQNPRNYSSAAGYTASSGGLGITDPSQVICVKGDGTRFVNETTMNLVIPTQLGTDPYAPLPYGGAQNNGESSEWPEHQFARAWLNLPDRPRNCWAIADANGAAALNWPVATIASPNPMVTPFLYPDSCATGATLQALAVEMGVSPSGLATTVANYNGYVTAGKDPDFGSIPKHQITTAPFYAVKWTIVRHTQRNGIRINSKAQVIDVQASQWMANQETNQNIVSINQEPVIPHLYAAGECTGGWGYRRYHNTLGLYSIYGRLAGQNGAAEPSLA